MKSAGWDLPLKEKAKQGPKAKDRSLLSSDSAEKRKRTSSKEKINLNKGKEQVL